MKERAIRFAMKIRELINPWATIRKLRADKAALEAECEDLYDRARDAEKAAYYKAAEHFEQRTKHLQSYNEHLLKQMTDIANLSPRPMLVTVAKGG